MTYVAVDKNGTEAIFQSEPERDYYPAEDIHFWQSADDDSNDNLRIELPSGSIEKLIGRTLTWDDEPVEL